MQQVPLKSVPNQQFSIVLDDNNWNITLRSMENQLSATLVLNTETIIENMRAVAGQMLIPYRYKEAGNFFFITALNQLPDYTQFNVTQSLIYISPDELASFRAPVTPPITDSFFNPLADLPLRYKPKGYVQA